MDGTLGGLMFFIRKKARQSYLQRSHDEYESQTASEVIMRG